MSFWSEFQKLSHLLCDAQRQTAELQTDETCDIIVLHSRRQPPPLIVKNEAAARSLMISCSQPEWTIQPSAGRAAAGQHISGWGALRVINSLFAWIHGPRLLRGGFKGHVDGTQLGKYRGKGEGCWVSVGQDYSISKPFSPWRLHFLHSLLFPSLSSVSHSLSLSLTALTQ